MNLLRGYYRLCLVGLCIGFFGTLLILTSYLPWRIRKIPVAAWMLTLCARAFFLILGVEFECPDPDRVRNHDGFLFANHVSYFDVFVVAYLVPGRFLAKAEVRPMPIIGKAAEALGCVFVDRENKASRAEARRQLARVETFPPIMIYPEGKRGPGDELLPLRYGAFEIVIRGQAAVLPCVIVYDEPETVIWKRSEGLLEAIWRMASRPGQLRATLIPLPIIQPQPDDDPATLAESTWAQMSAVYHHPETAVSTTLPGSSQHAA